MTKIKICGMRCENDIHIINKYCPDYAGFVFAKGKRCISMEQGKLLTGMLDIKIRKVGVFVNESADNVIKICNECMLDVIQLHGDETQSYLSELKQRLIAGRFSNYKRITNSICEINVKNNVIEIWKVIRIKDAYSILAIKDYKADRYVADSWQEKCYGGSGRVFNWGMLSNNANKESIILAGGLNPGNVNQAISILKPYAVDVSSGVEIDGYKDENKIRDFIHGIRNVITGRNMLAINENQQI
jgi:phosphoribosylanthranilate isomerase